jgi:hypothetical protein
MATQQQPTTQATQTQDGAQTEDTSQTALAIGNLPDSVKNALILKRQQNIVSAQIAGTNWGKGLDRDTRRAIADWGQRVGIDPATELNVLGGSFYKNAVYYIRRQAELMADGVVEYAYAEHVEVNAELTQMAQRDDASGQWARAEIDRRAKQRMLHNIPIKAASSVVWHVKVRGVPLEFVGAKWCGGGTRQKDPVGDEHPVETSETRAARRCMRLLSEWRAPNEQLRERLKALVEPNDDDRIDADIGEKLREGLRQAKEDQERSLEQARGHSILTLNAGDPYGIDQLVEKPKGEPVAVQEAPAKSKTRSDPSNPAADWNGNVPVLHDEEPDTRPSAAPVDEDINDLDLLSADERRDYEEKKRQGRS